NAPVPGVTVKRLAYTDGVCVEPLLRLSAVSAEPSSSWNWIEPAGAHGARTLFARGPAVNEAGSRSERLLSFALRTGSCDADIAFLIGAGEACTCGRGIGRFAASAVIANVRFDAPAAFAMFSVDVPLPSAGAVIVRELGVTVADGVLLTVSV